MLFPHIPVSLSGGVGDTSGYRRRLDAKRPAADIPSSAWRYNYFNQNKNIPKENPKQIAGAKRLQKKTPGVTTSALRTTNGPTGAKEAPMIDNARATMLPSCYSDKWLFIKYVPSAIPIPAPTPTDFVNQSIEGSKIRPFAPIFRG